MKLRNYILNVAACTAVVCGGVAYAQQQTVVYEQQPTVVYEQQPAPVVVYQQQPVVNIDPHRHGNLAAAQGYVVDAYQRIQRAQSANHGELGGHAQRAKELLTQAEAELRLAADVANAEGH
jgi:hypothetical protein